MNMLAAKRRRVAGPRRLHPSIVPINGIALYSRAGPKAPKAAPRRAP